MAFTVRTSAFGDSETVPTRFTCDGENTAPPLEIANTPEGTRSFALIMDDPDAPRGTFTHWLAYDIPVDGETLRPTSGKSLKNSFGKSGYGGPCPPPGHGPHRYFFSVYALDRSTLEVKGSERKDLEAALVGHVLATARVMGRYERAK